MVRTGLLIIFTRVPVPGETKTRLIPALGAEGAARLHMQLLEHTIDIARQSRFQTIEIHSFPDTKNHLLHNLAEKSGICIHPQQGKDLGKRMFNSLSSGLSCHDFAALVGSDCPDMNREILDQAYDILEKAKYQAVLGPSKDGGYYLIGMNTAEPSLFRKIEWGGSDVANMTRKKMATLEWQWQETAELSDIDVPADLELLRENPGFSTCLQVSFDN